MTSRWKERTGRVALVITSLAVSVAAGEMVLRILGFEPWRPGESVSGVPRVHEFDSQLGWKNKPGSYTVPRFAPDGQETQMTILRDGGRRTSATPSTVDEEIWLVGGSFTQGWAISDHDTYGWLLQRALPAWKISNFGTGGYGTYQSLLLVERLFSQRPPPRILIYGFAQFHEGRNVAASGWLRSLARYSARGSVAVPYCEIGANGQLACHPPTRYPAWPLRESSSIVNTLQDRYCRLSAKPRLGSGHIVTTQLLTRLDALCRQHGVTLVVVELDFESEAVRRSYEEFLQSRDIPVINCTRPDIDRMLVPGEAHPNAQLNQLWADCIREAVFEYLRW